MSILTITLQTRLPDNILEMDKSERETSQKEIVEKFQKEAEKNPEKISSEYFELALGEKPGLLFWNSLLWAISFLPITYYILKKTGAKLNLLSDDLNFGSISTGVMAGFSVFFLVSSISLILLIIGYKPKGNFFQTALFKNLKDNTYLLAWSIYSIGIITGIIEEWFFRGFLLTHFIGISATRIGLAITSAIFGAVHYSPEASPVIPIILSFVGFCFGYFYIRTRNIWVSISAHATYNSLGLLLAFFLGEKVV
ncbi:MAG: CPBP family intramembrane metalloprotease [Leptospiraceae bacterium]|nr:CPBP family intramembrane metalloprotease [Leptospiraceae bacterium]